MPLRLRMESKGRIMGIDFGMQRCGLAVTDPLQIAVNGLGWVETKNFFSFFEQYYQENLVFKIVFGLPVHKDGTQTYLVNSIISCANELQRKYAELEIAYQDESLSSAKAVSALIQAGVPKEKRKNKGLVDKISAVIILQRYLGHY